MLPLYNVYFPWSNAVHAVNPCPLGIYKNDRGTASDQHIFYYQIRVPVLFHSSHPLDCRINWYFLPFSVKCTLSNSYGIRTLGVTLANHHLLLVSSLLSSHHLPRYLHHLFLFSFHTGPSWLATVTLRDGFPICACADWQSFLHLSSSVWV